LVPHRRWSRFPTTKVFACFVTGVYGRLEIFGRQYLLLQAKLHGIVESFGGLILKIK